MRRITCDNCDEEINEEHYEICTYKYNGDQEIEEEDSCDFCSKRCVGKWMIDKAKEAYGVYG